MFDHEKREFIAVMQTVGSYYDRELTMETVGIYWRGLADLPLETVRAALDAHVQDATSGRFMPKIADIRRQVAANSDDGHPGPEEAWSIALQARHESASVVWTDQIAAAFFQAAMPLLDEGDKIAARKAFQERYEREVEQARRGAVPAKWVASLGSDQEARVRAINAALERGRLTAEHADRLMPRLEAPRKEVVALLSSAMAPQDTVSAKERIAQLRTVLGGRHAS